MRLISFFIAGTIGCIYTPREKGFYLIARDVIYILRIETSRARAGEVFRLIFGTRPCARGMSLIEGQEEGEKKEGVKRWSGGVRERFGPI